MADSLLGRTVELDVGGPAAGGACVARLDGPHGRVVFVRHALPGERVRAEITEDRGGSYCRADAVQVLQPAAGRVEAPCPHAGPGRCGGCDWQHASASAQRELKATVIRDQFTRLAGLDLNGVFDGVEELPAGLLGWRTRIAFAVDRDGRLGLHRHGTHEVQVVDRCPLGVPGVGDADVLDERWPGLRAVEVVAPGDDADGPASVVGHRAARAGRQARGRRPPDRLEILSGPAVVRHEVAGRPFEVAATGFWQVHPAAAATLTAAVLDAAAPRRGDTVLDLYAGAGMLTAALAEATGPDGTVLGVEGDRQAVADATANLADLPWARMEVARVGALELSGHVDVVVLDPPRSGAGTAVMRTLSQLTPRVICYVSCDPATLARDVAALRELGWELARLRAFDAFPMTHHVECVATVRRQTAT